MKNGDLIRIKYFNSLFNSQQQELLKYAHLEDFKIIQGKKCKILAFSGNIFVLSECTGVAFYDFVIDRNIKINN